MRNKFIIIGVAVIVVVIGVLAFLANGKAVPDTTSVVKNTQPSAVIVPFTKIAQGNHSMVMGRVNYIITSSDDLSNLWKMVDATSTIPTINFKTHAVIATFVGEAVNSKITITKIEDTSVRTVFMTVTNPSGTCSEKKSALSPYEIAIVPVTSLPLKHEDIVATTSCGN